MKNQPGVKKVPVPGHNDLRPSVPEAKYGEGREGLRHAVGNTRVFDFRTDSADTSPASAAHGVESRKTSPRS